MGSRGIRATTETGIVADLVRTQRRHAVSTTATPVENVNTVAASGATQTLPDVFSATMHDITLTASCTFTFPAAGEGKSFSMRLKQGGSGSYAATWPASVKWDAGLAPPLSTSVGAVDTRWFACFDGARWEAGVGGSGHA